MRSLPVSSQSLLKAPFGREHDHIKPYLYLLACHDIFCLDNHVLALRIFGNSCNLSFGKRDIRVVLHLPVELFISSGRPEVYVEYPCLGIRVLLLT